VAFEGPFQPGPFCDLMSPSCASRGAARRHGVKRCRVWAVPGPGSLQPFCCTPKPPGRAPRRPFPASSHPSSPVLRDGAQHGECPAGLRRMPSRTCRHAQPGWHGMLSRTCPRLRSHCTLRSGTGTPLGPAPAASSALQNIK